MKKDFSFTTDVGGSYTFEIFSNHCASKLTNKTIYIGVMGGGVFQSVNGGITWKTVSDNMMVSCMAQTEDGSIYVGTGDGRSAHKNNGLAELNYETSFAGSGLYKLGEDSPVQDTEGWKFINDIAVVGNTVYAATNEGLYRYEDNTLTALIDKVEVFGVETCVNGDVLAVVDKDVYLFKGTDYTVMTSGDANMLPKDETYKIIATSPSDFWNILRQKPYHFYSQCVAR